MVFDAKPLRNGGGGLDFERILNNYEWSFETVPRYRQRIAKVPFLDHPVWVDDPSFNVRYHIRQIALPQPADERILKRVCGYLLELPLDMAKPLWEVWIVDEDPPLHGGWDLRPRDHPDAARSPTFLAQGDPSDMDCSTCAWRSRARESRGEPSPSGATRATRRVEDNRRSTRQRA